MTDTKTPPRTLAGTTLNRWAEEQPWHYIPPLLISATDDTEPESLLETINEEFVPHDYSEPEIVGFQTISGVMLSCEVLAELAEMESVRHVEIEGYGKVGI